MLFFQNFFGTSKKTEPRSSRRKVAPEPIEKKTALFSPRITMTTVSGDSDQEVEYRYTSLEEQKQEQAKKQNKGKGRKRRETKDSETSVSSNGTATTTNSTSSIQSQGEKFHELMDESGRAKPDGPNDDYDGDVNINMLNKFALDMQKVICYLDMIPPSDKTDEAVYQKNKPFILKIFRMTQEAASLSLEKDSEAYKDGIRKYLDAVASQNLHHKNNKAKDSKTLELSKEPQLKSFLLMLSYIAFLTGASRFNLFDANGENVEGRIELDEFMDLKRYEIFQNLQCFGGYLAEYLLEDELKDLVKRFDDVKDVIRNMYRLLNGESNRLQHVTEAALEILKTEKILIGLEIFEKSTESDTKKIAKEINQACLKHFFQKHDLAELMFLLIIHPEPKYLEEFENFNVTVPEEGLFSVKSESENGEEESLDLSDEESEEHFAVHPEECRPTEKYYSGRTQYSYFQPQKDSEFIANNTQVENFSPAIYPELSIKTR